MSMDQSVSPLQKELNMKKRIELPDVKFINNMFQNLFGTNDVGVNTFLT